LWIRGSNTGARRNEIPSGGTLNLAGIIIEFVSGIDPGDGRGNHLGQRLVQFGRDQAFVRVGLAATACEL
jgi:hypothetical protein